MEGEAKRILPWIAVLMLSCNAILGIEEGKPLEGSSDWDASSSSGSGAEAEPAAGGTGASSAAEGGLGGASAGGAPAGGSGGGSGGANGGSGGTSGGADGGSGGGLGGTAGAARDGGTGASGGGACYWDCAGCDISSTSCCAAAGCDCGTTEVCEHYVGQACTAPDSTRKFVTKRSAVCIDAIGIICDVRVCRCVCL
jgi:hypothetical protein